MSECLSDVISCNASVLRPGDTLCPECVCVCVCECVCVWKALVNCQGSGMHFTTFFGSSRGAGHVHWSPAQRRGPLHMLIFSGDVLRAYLPFSRYMAARLRPELSQTTS